MRTLTARLLGVLILLAAAGLDRPRGGEAGSPPPHASAGAGPALALPGSGWTQPFTARLFAQTPVRRLTTIEAVRAFPVYFHLATVVLRGEFIEQETELVLAADGHWLRLLNPSEAKGGPVEVRGEIIDVGKLERTDPRLGPYAERFKEDGWPRAGEELVLRLTSVSDAQFAAQPSVRALSLEPWKFEGQKVTVSGIFRGRNLFGDLPAAPGRSRNDFVLTGVEGALWVTELRARGRGFDLNVERRNDAGRWLEVTGVVQRHRGMALLKGDTVAATERPSTATAPFEPAPAAAPISPPVTVVFSDPTADELGVATGTSVRVQFSRGLQADSLEGQVRVAYLDGPTAALAFKTSYDAAARALRIDFSAPLEPFRTVKVELLGGIRGFDDAPFEPWAFTFSTAGL